MMTTDLLHANAHLIVPSGVRSCRSPPCYRACNASADSAYQVLHFALLSNVQTTRPKRAQPAALAAFVGVLPAHVPPPPPRRCREPKRPAKAEGKIEGRSTKVCAKRVCTWEGRGTTRPCRCAAWGANVALSLPCPRASHDQTRHRFTRTQP